MSQRIETTITDGVADVRLVRGDKMNALDQAMFEALVETAASLEADRRVRCVVLSGEGRGFCAGLDMASFETFAAGDRMDLQPRTHGDANLPQQAALAWRRLRAPVLIAAHGVALGGGFQIMMGADIRFVHPQTKLSILEVKWGIVPDLGGSILFPGAAREDVIRELTYTGRVFSGEEALGYGFATHVTEQPYDDAHALAREIASKSPEAVQGAKRIYNALGAEREAAQLQLESDLQTEIIGAPNQIEAVMAALQKREARFSD